MTIPKLIKKDFLLFSKSISGIIMTFAVPMIITLIFGAIFGGFGGDNGISELRLLVVDDDKTDFSKQLVTLLDSLDAIKIYSTYKNDETNTVLNMEVMDSNIKKGSFKVGIRILSGFENNYNNGEKLKLEIHYDPKFIIEYNIVNGIIQKTIMKDFPQVMMNSMFKNAREYLGSDQGTFFENDMNKTIEKFFGTEDSEGAESQTPSDSAIKQDDNFNMMGDPIDIKSVELLGVEEENPYFAQYVAGMAVMFLLFSVTNAGASLLDEKNNGTIKRLLVAPVTRNQILTAKMFYIMIMAIFQLLVLFTFGWLVFKLNIFKDIPALLSMIIVTAFACSALGIFIASICKNQHQVSSISTLIILGMSALGGSMVPLMIMPAYIKKIARFTLNYWAMKGFTDIFWRNLHLKDIVPSLIVLSLITIVFTTIALSIFNKKLMEK
ncbi:MAG: ABC transporter permease [Candidatus Cloacimonetes bacterium]|nr:ABC transporter permease [Candidatus Cloacimonadota bacterium]